MKILLLMTMWKTSLLKYLSLLVLWGDYIDSYLQTLWLSYTILWCIPIWLMLYWHWGRLGRANAAKIECAHRRACKLLTDYNHRILTFHSIYDYFALVKAFNTNILNFHQYFKDKLSSHQPSHMYNTRHRTNNFNTPPLNHSKTQKCYLYQVIHIWNSLPSSLKNCTSKFT